MSKETTIVTVADCRERVALDLMKLIIMHNAVPEVVTTATGAPHYIDNSGVYYRLTSGSIGLLSDGFQRSVSLAPISGRVTVQ